MRRVQRAQESLTGSRDKPSFWSEIKIVRIYFPLTSVLPVGVDIAPPVVTQASLIKALQIRLSPEGLHHYRKQWQSWSKPNCYLFLSCALASVQFLSSRFQ
jgi:hypothetical protein